MTEAELQKILSTPIPLNKRDEADKAFQDVIDSGLTDIVYLICSNVKATRGFWIETVRNKMGYRDYVIRKFKK